MGTGESLRTACDQFALRALEERASWPFVRATNSQLDSMQGYFYQARYALLLLLRHNKVDSNVRLSS